MMQIVIPTHGRKGEQLTVQWISGSELIKRTTLVCPEKDYSSLRAMRDDYNVEIQPDSEWKIAKKREWIIQEWVRRGHDKIIMLDDDLRFAKRVSREDWHLKEIRGTDLIEEFQRIEDKLGPDCPHAGFGQRQGNNNLLPEDIGWKTPGKMVCTLGYYLPVVAKEARWDLTELREDMCVTLQLLLKGYPNAIWTETVADQRQFDAPGGCSRYRTVEVNNAEAERLSNLFPNYVSLKRRKYKGGADRIEVVVAWKKALEDGQNARNRCGERS